MAILGLGGAVAIWIACTGKENALRGLGDPPAESKPEGAQPEIVEIDLPSKPVERHPGTVDPPPPAPIQFPSLSGWEFFGPQHGGPARVYGVSADEAGNLWVAGGTEGLFLLPTGTERFRRFTATEGLAHYKDVFGTHPHPVISVAGGPANTVFVGYQGLHGALGDLDPDYMRISGDADKVVLKPEGLEITHFDISTPPGVSSSHPDGRDKIRTIYRLLYNRTTGDVWFGGNHGVAMWDGRRNRLYEHKHAAINGYTATGAHTMLSGDWYGIALDPMGDFWFGGGHRSAKIPYGASRNFSADFDEIDIWPDEKSNNAHPEERTDDYVQDMAALPDGSLWVGSIKNSLAHLGPMGISYLREGMVDPKVTALEADPANSSLWVGHIYGGITRIQGGALNHLDYRSFGPLLILGTIPDIQSDNFGGQRRILVAFEKGAIGIYTGP
jgi:hypothetical protein